MNFQDYFCERDPKAFPRWQQAIVGIAGAGGLGSNAAIMLARAGIGELILADFDMVSLSNLNRQAFDLSQVGSPKVEALCANIRRFNPYIRLRSHSIKISAENAADIFADADILIEAFDTAEAKEMLIYAWQKAFPAKPLICASGISGYGRSEEIRILAQDSLYVVGDLKSELETGIAPIAPRVNLVAAMQANLCLELLAAPLKDQT